MRNVLYITHQCVGPLHGGAEIQLMSTMKAINFQNDYRVKLFDPWNDRLESFDLIHIFNPRGFPLECETISRYASDIGIPVVVSPIFFKSQTHSRMKDGAFLMSVVDHNLSAFKRLFSIKPLRYVDPYKQLRVTLELASKILPNTQEERNQIMSLFNIHLEKTTVVPNGVDLRMKDGDPNIFKKQFGIDDFILFVGRIEPRKNVLKLIKSFNDSKLDTKLVIIGDSTNPTYLSQCKKELNETRTIMLPRIPHESPLLSSAYKAAKVLALPSEFETPGLVAMEAGLAGSNIVITENGGTKEYFGDMAWYVNPSDPKSISNALQEAFLSPRGVKLSKHIETNFTWEAIGKKTSAIYDRVLSTK